MKKVIHTSGKRKTAIARGKFRAGKGSVRINKSPVELYHPELARLKIKEPLTLAGELVNNVDIDVKVVGGGVMGQAEAARMVIAKGLVQWTSDMDLKEKFNLVRQNHACGRPTPYRTKKIRWNGARARKQKSYR